MRGSKHLSVRDRAGDDSDFAGAVSNLQFRGGTVPAARTTCR